MTVAVDKTLPFVHDIPKDVTDVSQLLTHICGDWPRQQKSDPGNQPAEPPSLDREYHTASSVCSMLTDPDGHAGLLSSETYYDGLTTGIMVVLAVWLVALFGRSVRRQVGAALRRYRVGPASDVKGVGAPLPRHPGT